MGNFENRTTISDIFSQFSAAHAQKRPEIHFRSNFEFKIGNPYGLFPIRLRISAALTTGFMRVLAKTAFVVQNSRNLGANGGDQFLTKPTKCTSLANFTRLFARRLDEKRDTTKSHREVILHLFAGNSPLNQIKHSAQ